MRRVAARRAASVCVVAVACCAGVATARAQAVSPSNFPAVAASAGSATQASGASGAGAAKARSGSRLTRDDAAFLQDAARAGLAEMEAAKVAVAKGVNTQVKGFAQQMLDEHAASQQALATLAAAKGIGIPDKPSFAQRAKIKLLSSVDGGSFDRSYADAMGVSAHQDALRLYQRAAAKAADADVKAFAAKAVPILQQHLQVARDLKRTVDQEGNAKAPKDRAQ